ncbi:MAG: hypothetical protein LBJ95_01940 [Oscillospiraceae bacterium]|jgi:hypothetical protein|nr:hypothetical protein [Oscillospiraceae bacterium]
MKKLLSFMTIFLLAAETTNFLSVNAVIEADFPADTTKSSIVIETIRPSDHKRLKQFLVTRDPIVKANFRLVIEDATYNGNTKVTLFASPDLTNNTAQGWNYVQGVIWLYENPTGTVTGIKATPWKASFGWDLSHKEGIQESKFEMLATNLTQVNTDIGGHHAVIYLQ